MSRTRVLHILNSLRPSGAEVMLRVAAPHWASAGIDAEILSVGDVVGSYAPVLAEAGYGLHHLPFSRGPGFFRSLHRLLRRGGYDVVHVHAERANFYYALTARAAGVPRVVRTLHGVFPFRGALRVRRTVQRRLLRAMGCVHVSISPSVARVERDHFANPTVQIPNWYDAARLAPPTAAQRRAARARYGLPDDALAVVSVGNCSAVKNHGELLKAVAAIDGRHRPYYLHVGEEGGGCGEREAAAALGIEGRTRFVGFAADVRPPLHAADVFVMPSLHEGFGIAAVEAMGCGLPAILSDVPGLQDFKVLSDDILWAEPEAGSLAEALARATELGPAGRAARGLRLHEAVRSRYGVEAGVAAYVRAYRGTTMAGADGCAAATAAAASSPAVSLEATCC